MGSVTDGQNVRNKGWHHFFSDDVMEVVCDMSPAFLAAVKEEFGEANVTVDWFHVVQLFTRAVDDVRRQEQKTNKLPKATRWAVLQGSGLTKNQAQALAELKNGDFCTTIAWRIKEKLRWIRGANTPRAALWRMTNFFNHARSMLTDAPELEVIRNALKTLETHQQRILQPLVINLHQCPHGRLELALPSRPRKSKGIPQ